MVKFKKKKVGRQKLIAGGWNQIHDVLHIMNAAKLWDNTSNGMS